MCLTFGACAVIPTQLHRNASCCSFTASCGASTPGQLHADAYNLHGSALASAWSPAFTRGAADVP